ncbi:MAG: glycosyltransferase family 4 protein, partial [Sphingobacteriaceae bacterium]
VNVAFPASIALPLFKDHFKVKHTIVEHWSGYLKEDGNYRGTVMRHFTKKCFNHCSKIYYVSERQKESLIHHGLSGNFELIYNAIDTSIFKPLPSGTKTRTTFLHVSSLVEREKNLSGTFKALKIIQNKGFDLDLVIIGGNADSINDTKILQNKVGVKNIAYLGYKTKNEIAEQMNKSDALLLFSNFEGMPVVALEALACELPVLASDVGQLPHLISPEFGKLVKRNDTGCFSEILEKFSEGKFSFNKPKMREFILQHASYEAVGKQLFAYYQTV